MLRRLKLKHRILICGDSFKRISGLSYIALSMFKYFKDRDYDVAYCIISGTEESIVSPKDIENKGHYFYEYIKDEMIFNSQVELKDTCNIFDKAVEYFKPDIVFSIHDFWRLDKIASSNYRDTYKWVAYCPIESNFYFSHIIYPNAFNPEYRKSIKKIAEDIDLLIPYTDMGKEVLTFLKSNNQERITDKVFNGIDFYYEDQNDLNRQDIFGGLVKEDDFVFITTGNNFTRKGLNYIIEAFYLFLKEIKNPEKYKLYIHGNIDTLNSGTDIKSMLYSLGILDNCILCKNEQISKKELYRRYKMSDCYIGLPLAEGFGLGFAEALINKLPVIYHNYGGHKEYLEGIGYPVSSVSNYHPVNQFTIWKIPDVNQTKDIMKYITTNKNSKEVKDKIYEGYNFAKDNLLWSNIYCKFDKIFSEFENILFKEDIVNKLHIRRIV